MLLPLQNETLGLICVQWKIFVRLRVDHRKNLEEESASRETILTVLLIDHRNGNLEEESALKGKGKSL